MGAGQLDRPVTIALIENESVVVAGVRKWVADDSDGRVRVVAVGKSIEAALNGPGRDADVVVLDLELGDRESGKEMVTPRVAGLCAEGFRVVVFSMHVEPLIVQTVLKAGASAFLDKQTEEDQFVDTIVAVAQDRPFVTPSMAGGILNGCQLSGRESEALRYLFQGMTYASIARRLTKPDGKPISAHTAKDYINRARAKFATVGLHCRSNYALLARCIELGLIRPEEIEDYHPANSLSDQGARSELRGRDAAIPCPPFRGHALTPQERQSGPETGGDRDANGAEGRPAATPSVGRQSSPEGSDHE